jgi:uncharacterized phage-associated protein
MNSPLSSESVANWFIERAHKAGDNITAMKLQKLLFYAHGWCLGLYGWPLVADQVEAWTYGPVFPRIYHLAKSYGSHPITSQLYDYFSELSQVPAGDPRVHLLEKIWELYGEYTAAQLSHMTHEPSGPWARIRRDNPGRKGTDIPDSLLREYFGRLATGV